MLLSSQDSITEARTLGKLILACLSSQSFAIQRRWPESLTHPLLGNISPHVSPEACAGDTAIDPPGRLSTQGLETWAQVPDASSEIPLLIGAHRNLAQKEPMGIPSFLRDPPVPGWSFLLLKLAGEPPSLSINPHLLFHGAPQSLR
ncbi:hypothetical protein H1C71_017546 [Ictidomys tridecemlineatus]|nr:hypothetical protein H1C71_017546 [Ictidomys tridecemlineatus]